MTAAHDTVVAVSLPTASGISAIYATVDLADAYAIALPEDASADPEQLARFIFAQQSFWARGLMGLRDWLVAGFGLKTARHLAALDAQHRARRVGIFKIYAAGETEIVLGEDDKHLDFRLSVMCTGPASQGDRRLVLSTVVHCHNRLGRLYIFLIAPFHRAIVQASLRRAARIGWPAATAA